MKTNNFQYNNMSWTYILETLNKCDNASGKLGYIISKARRNISLELAPFEDQRLKLFKKYGEPLKDNSQQLFIKTDSPKYQEFLNEFKPIAEDITVTIPILQISEKEFEQSNIFDNDLKVQDYDILENLFIYKEETQQ